MFIAHLPAGYICASIGESKSTECYKANVFWMLLLGSILPDIDMFYFYLVDGKQTHHHLYWTHLPVFWVSVYVLTVATLISLRQKEWFIAVSALFAGVFLHLILDTPVGGIAWLSPFSNQLLYFVEVPATQAWWVWSFVLHWTFAVEIFICLAAGFMFINNRRIKRR